MQTESGKLQGLVNLLQCGRRSCGYVLIEQEYSWKRSWMGKTAICPICANDEFFRLKETGQKMTMRDRDQYRDGIDPHKIEATPRMGLKMKTYLADVKKRAIQIINQEVQP